MKFINLLIKEILFKLNEYLLSLMNELNISSLLKYTTVFLYLFNIIFLYSSNEYPLTSQYKNVVFLCLFVIFFK